MAINPLTEYPAGTAAATGDYPYGEPKNASTPTGVDGYPWEAAGILDWHGLFQGLIHQSGITLSGNPDTAIDSQYLQAMVRMFGPSGNVYVDSSTTANAYKLDPISGATLKEYYDGMLIAFNPASVHQNGNTGACTVQIGALAVKALTHGQASLPVTPYEVTGLTWAKFSQTFDVFVLHHFDRDIVTESTFLAPTTANADGLADVYDLTAGAGSFSNIVNPAYPRNIVFNLTDADGSISAITIKVEATTILSGSFDITVEKSFTPSGSIVFDMDIPASYISSASVVSVTGAAAGDTIGFGFGDKFGLPLNIDSALRVPKILIDGVNKTDGVFDYSGITDADWNTIDLGSGLVPNGVRNFQIYTRS